MDANVVLLQPRLTTTATPASAAAVEADTFIPREASAYVFLLLRVSLMPLFLLLV
jgi:hypothetical protein